MSWDCPTFKMGYRPIAHLSPIFCPVRGNLDKSWTNIGHELDKKRTFCPNGVQFMSKVCLAGTKWAMGGQWVVGYEWEMFWGHNEKVVIVSTNLRIWVASISQRFVRGQNIVIFMEVCRNVELGQKVVKIWICMSPEIDQHLSTCSVTRWQLSEMTKRGQKLGTGICVLIHDQPWNAPRCYLTRLLLAQAGFFGTRPPSAITHVQKKRSTLYRCIMRKQSRQRLWRSTKKMGNLLIQWS